MKYKMIVYKTENFVELKCKEPTALFWDIYALGYDVYMFGNNIVVIVGHRLEYLIYSLESLGYFTEPLKGVKK